jgi:hypothetical protein
VRLEDSLRQIEPDDANLVHGRHPLAVPSTPHLGTLMPSGGVHPIAYGDVGDPELVRSVDDHALGPVGEDRAIVIAVGGGDEPAVPPRLQVGARASAGAPACY